MGFLGKIFKRRRAIEDIEALGKLFRFSRPEDIAKVFELWRIEALRTLKRDVWYFIGVVSAVIGIITFLFGWELLKKYLDSIVDSRVEREIDKRINRFSEFYAYSQDVIPILEHDFYKIRSVQHKLKVKNNQDIEKIVVYKDEFGLRTQALDLGFWIRIGGILKSDIHKYEYVVYYVSTKDYESSTSQDDVFTGNDYIHLVDNHMVFFENFDNLEVKISINIRELDFPESYLLQLSDKLDVYINSIDEVIIEIYINGTAFYKKLLKRTDFKKSDKLEYSAKINWRDVFKRYGSVKNYYRKLLEAERQR